jgi:hypothetical protein
VLPTSWFTEERAQISWHLSLKAYCGVDNLHLMPFTNVVEGFVHTKTVWWEDYDVTGYIGYMPSQETIYVVYRGTQSALNWELDFMVKKVSYEETWPECNCKVHEGVNMGINHINE